MSTEGQVEGCQSRSEVSKASKASKALKVSKVSKVSKVLKVSGVDLSSDTSSESFFGGITTMRNDEDQ